MIVTDDRSRLVDAVKLQTMHTWLYIFQSFMSSVRYAWVWYITSITISRFQIIVTNISLTCVQPCSGIFLFIPFQSFLMQLWYKYVYNKYSVPQGLCFVVFCFAFIIRNNSNIFQGCFISFRAIAWWPQCQWSDPEEYGFINHKNSQKCHVTKNTTQPNQAVCVLYVLYCSTAPLLISLASIL